MSESAPRDVRRIVAKIVAQATIAVVAAAGGLSVIEMSPGSVASGANSQEIMSANAPSANSIVDASAVPGSSYASSLAASPNTAQVNPILRQPNVQQSSSLARFLSRQPAKMSEQTRTLAGLALERRANSTAENGDVWAERVMKNIYTTS
ncbi:hypothetical protein [Paraburkholderia sp. DHOC27]|uniref:hypothetical protein n=1 Tax=Paraburkholderia sp. DHOC27 TaxID=2303330 RepID=UPI0011C18C03|nr:hypothetical protein [Paraburkholderia sp. DHOC27]